MGIIDGLMGNDSETDIEDIKEKYQKLLAPGETIEQAYSLIRDKILLTNMRMILINKQGVTGKKTEYHSIPYGKITHCSIEIAGNLDMEGIKIRTAFPQDSEQIRDIYAPYVEQTAITFETEVPTVTEMIHRMENVIWRYPYLVIEGDERILGYAYASPFIGRAAYDWSVEMSVYLRMDERQHGLGKMLYLQMEDVLHAQGFLLSNLFVHLFNGAA